MQEIKEEARAPKCCKSSKQAGQTRITLVSRDEQKTKENAMKAEMSWRRKKKPQKGWCVKHDRWALKPQAKGLAHEPEGDLALPIGFSPEEEKQ